MPIYEYVCKTCEYEFEKIRSFSDSTTPLCPSCESDKVERKLGVPAIHFKGSGWYINDSKSKNSNGTTTKDSSNGETTSDSSTSDKGEAPSSESKSSTESKSSDTSTTSTKEASTKNEKSTSSVKKAD